MILINLSYGSALQAIWARDSYAITIARSTFARAHGITPAEVAVTTDQVPGSLEAAPTADELVIINAA
jgi:hypothetical protein